MFGLWLPPFYRAQISLREHINMCQRQCSIRGGWDGRSETSLYCSNVQKCTHISTLPRHLLFTCRGRTNIPLSQQLFWRTLYLAKSIQYLPSNPDSSIFIEIMRVQSLFFNKSVAKRNWVQLRSI